MKKILFTFTLAFISCTFCFGQENADYKSAIKKMLIVSGGEKTFQGAITQMINMFKAQKSEVPAEFWDAMSTEFLKTSTTDIADMLTPIYQRHLSLEDVNQFIAFYESPIGKKFAEKTPLITQESMAVGSEWGQRMAQKIIDKINNVKKLD